MKTNSLILINNNEQYFIEDTLNKQTQEISKTDYDKLISESIGIEQLDSNRLLCEFTIQQWLPQIMPIIKRTKSIRRNLLGKESSNTKFIDIQGSPKNPILVFSTNATYNSSKKYLVKIQLLDLSKWRKGKYLYSMNNNEFKEILNVCEIKLFCECKGWHWIGLKYMATQLDSAIITTSISNKVWSKRIGYSEPSLCKHLAGILPLIKTNSSKILKSLKSKFSNKYRSIN